VLFAAVVGLWITGVVMKNNKHDNYVSQPTYTPTYQPSYDPTSPGPTEQPTSAPTAPTTAPKPTAPAPTKTTPPPAPRPSDTDIVAKNAFYKSGVQRTVNCKEPAARANSGANARKYYVGVLACLNKAWPRNLALAKQNFRAPNLVSFTGPIQTPCSGGAPSSFYCSVNQTIYMDAKGDIDDFKKYSTFNNRSEALAYLRAGMVDTVAHEYGHHLQNLTGILSASDNLQYERTGDAALQMSRKLEIQATCFGNVFMGANKGSYKFSGLLMSQLTFLHSHQGDEYGTRRDHGSRAIIPRWANAGFNARNPNVCNTYVAPAALVR
jgi:predicted metalloprotease